MPFSTTVPKPSKTSSRQGQKYQAIKFYKQERPPASMNPLLVKSEIGKSRPPVYDLPGPEHFYGCKSERVNEAEEQAIAFAAAKHPEKPPMTDYVASNRAAAKEGVVTPQQTREYRERHPRPVKIGGSAGKFAALTAAKTGSLTGSSIIALKSKGKLPSDQNPNFVYGQPTRPSTPVATLMSDKYAKQWQLEQRQREEDQNKSDREKKHGKPKVMTKTPQAKKIPKSEALVKTQPEHLFRMTKFTKIGPKVVTTRTTRDGKTVVTVQAGASGSAGPLSRAAAYHNERLTHVPKGNAVVLRHEPTVSFDFGEDPISHKINAVTAEAVMV